MLEYASINYKVHAYILHAWCYWEPQSFCKGFGLCLQDYHLAEYELTLRALLTEE
jgi:hypothetical protein